MEIIRFAEDVGVKIAKPTAHPVKEGLIESLSLVLSQYPQVSHSYLVQFTYPPGHDASIGDEPCLTCVLRIEGDPENMIFNEISREGEAAINSFTREWRFLDFFRFMGPIGKAIERTTEPFYTR